MQATSTFAGFSWKLNKGLLPHKENIEHMMRIIYNSRSPFESVPRTTLCQSYLPLVAIVPSWLLKNTNSTDKLSEPHPSQVMASSVSPQQVPTCYEKSHLFFLDFIQLVWASVCPCLLWCTTVTSGVLWVTV